MKPPKCRNNCERGAHFGPCHVFVSPAPSRVTPPTVAVASAPNVVVDTAREREGAVVDARSRDRHRKTAKRREYLRLAQRRSRAARRVSP